ncbi:MAG: protein translocase subunit SecF [Candidatus Nanopelagicales bacterium]
MSKKPLGARLYDGDIAIDFVGRRRTWYIVSAIILLVAVGALFFRGLNLGVEFRGGATFTVPKAACSVEDARNATQSVVGGEPTVTQTGAGLIRVQTEPLTQQQNQDVTVALGAACGVSATDITVQAVGPSWGQEITSKALQALVVFLLLLALFLSIYFEWRMAVAALVALVHDVVITVGIYALTGLEVTPATVIGVLTILGYSLYDTVVVFDKVRENTKGITGQSMQTYAEAANLAVNQTLVRSINTTIVALLPIIAIIVVGAGLLGAGTLLDLAVALAVGMAAGAYSSIFIATPFLVQLKEGQADIKALDARVKSRRGGSGKKATESRDVPDAGDDPASTGLRTDPAIVTGQRSQPKRQPRSKRGKK